MPEGIVNHLLGAQGGAEDDFACLYYATNPVLVRYLAVNTDADIAPLALSAWASTLDRLKVCPPDDDAWIELVIGSARAAAAGSLRAHGRGSSPDAIGAHLDQVDHAIEVLRTCPPDEADVLSMGIIASLGREATSRLTGLEPHAVLDLVRRGQAHLEMSLAELIAALRTPGRPAELTGLGLVAPLATAALAAPMPAEAAATVTTAPETGATAAGSPEAAPSELSLADLLDVESAAPAASNVVSLTAARTATGTPSRSARVGAGAAVWLVALGGVGTAAAMSGLITVAIDAFRGDRGGSPSITAEGPVRPGPPSTDDGSTLAVPPVEPRSGSGQAEAPKPSSNQAAGRTRTGGGSATSPVSLTRGSTVVQIELASYVPPSSPTPSTPPAPEVPAATPVAPTTPPAPPAPQTLVPRPAKGGGTVVAAAAIPDKNKGKNHHGKARAHHHKGNAHHGKARTDHHKGNALHGKATAHHHKGSAKHHQGSAKHHQGKGHHHGRGSGNNRA